MNKQSGFEIKAEQRQSWQSIALVWAGGMICVPCLMVGGVLSGGGLPLPHIVAAILTPPDVVSQLLMACPMLILYECSILVAALCGKKKKDATEETDKAPAESGDADDAAKPGE